MLIAVSVVQVGSRSIVPAWRRFAREILGVPPVFRDKVRPISNRRFRRARTHGIIAVVRLCRGGCMISAIVLASFLSVAGDGKVSTEELVRRLGDKSFRVRDASARELLARGKDAIDALKRGADNTDPEVRERCRRLLTQLQARLIRERLDGFVNDVKSPP